VQWSNTVAGLFVKTVFNFECRKSDSNCRVDWWRVLYRYTAWIFSKKIIKILMFGAGGIVALLLYLQQQQVISVDVQKMEASSTFIFNLVASSFDKMTQIGDMSSLGIPLAASIAAGFTVALAKS